jgi:hypothetical protein
MERFRRMMLLMVLTGELDCDMNESRSELARDDVDDDRRNEVRMLWGEKRDAMAWKRVEGIMMAVVGVKLGLVVSECVCI